MGFTTDSRPEAAATSDDHGSAEEEDWEALLEEANASAAENAAKRARTSEASGSNVVGAPTTASAPHPGDGAVPLMVPPPQPYGTYVAPPAYGSYGSTASYGAAASYGTGASGPYKTGPPGAYATQTTFVNSPGAYGGHAYTGPLSSFSGAQAAYGGSGTQTTYSGMIWDGYQWVASKPAQSTQGLYKPTVSLCSGKTGCKCYQCVGKYDKDPGTKLFILRKIHREQHDDFSDDDLKKAFDKYGEVRRSPRGIATHWRPYH